MNKKQRKAMIAMELKVAGLEENIRNLWCAINPVVDDDVVEKIEMRLSRLAAMTEGRERDTEGAFLAFKERLDLLDTRMRHRDESIEALDEDLNKLNAGLTELEACVLRRIERIETNAGSERDVQIGYTNDRVAFLERQVNGINLRLIALTNKYLELRPKKQPKTGIEWGMGTAISPVPETLPANLLTLKKSEKPRKEYKKVMKKGASVG
jgi:predicted RNase H-like nuclease (RuvC/YqgF family)